jgi:hypothetical protein
VMSSVHVSCLVQIGMLHFPYVIFWICGVISRHHLVFFNPNSGHHRVSRSHILIQTTRRMLKRVVPF